VVKVLMVRFTGLLLIAIAPLNTDHNLL